MKSNPLEVRYQLAYAAAHYLALALDRAHRKRNELEYTGAVDVTEAETGSLIVAARALHKSVLDWIKSHRPELI